MFFIKRLAKYSFFLLCFSIFALGMLYLSMRSELPSVDSLKDMQWQTPMQIYSYEGELISQFGSKKRIPLTLAQMPQQLIDALLATEDDRFYLHFGVDPIGMTRAVIGQLSGNPKGGASTITMQVARNFFLTREVTYTRKLREIFLSFHIERLLSKEEILELYMNKIELGHRAFGFGAAAQVYYGKDINHLTLAQYAVLAGLPKAPSTLNPIRSPSRAKARRAVVLSRMLSAGYITDEEYQVANQAEITGKRHGAKIELNAPYVAEMAHKEMIERYGKEQAYTQGFKVFTTVSTKLQKAAQSAVISNLLAYDQRHGYRGAVMTLRPDATVSESESTNESAQLSPLTDDEISKVFKEQKTYQHLQPAIVNEINEDSITIIVKGNKHATIPWQGMSWARPYINDNKQGRPPKSAKEIFQFGDVIYVTHLNDNNYQLSQLPKVSSALVALSPDNGAIKAAVGGFSFKQSQFNRATQAKRQVGSNIKPFIYSAALEQRFTLASLINDAPINQWDKTTGVTWRPKNSPPQYDGPIRIRTALARSKNVVAVRLLREVGLDNVINHLAAFGFNPMELPKNESLALGSASLTPIEVATGFATFANGGFLIEPYIIERIEDSFGNVLFQANPKIAKAPAEPTLYKMLEAVEQSSEIKDESEPVVLSQPLAERVISAENAFLISQALNSAIWGSDWSITPGWQGTGFRARSLNRRDIAGKTGTTNEAKDAWFSGFSRRLVATSWIGFDDHQRNLGKTVYNSNLDKNQITGKEFGAKSAQPAWISFMKVALEDYPVEAFEQPEGLMSIRIDKATGKLTSKTDKSSIFEYFRPDRAPTEYISQDNSSDIFSGEQNNDEELF